MIKLAGRGSCHPLRFAVLLYLSVGLYELPVLPSLEALVHQIAMSHPNYNQQDKETYPGYYYTQQGYANSQYPNGPRNTFQAATSSQLQASYLPVNTNATLGYHPGSLSPYPTQPTFGEVMKNVEHDRDNAYIDRIVPSPRGAGWQGLEQ